LDRASEVTTQVVVQAARWSNMATTEAKVTKALQNRQKLSRFNVNLTRMNTGNDGPKAIAKAVTSGLVLKNICLSTNGITEDGCPFLATALKRNGVLEVLDLEDNEIKTGIKHLVEALDHNEALVDLSVAKNGLGDGGAQKVAELLKCRTVLKKVNLRGNCITEAGVRHLANALPHNDQLLGFDVSDNGLKDGGAMALAETLPQSSLADLNIYGNGIGSLGLEQLAKALPASRLVNLDLCMNAVRDEGAKSLSTALREEACTLKVLVISNCDIGESGVRDLAAALLQNTSLTELYLGGNEFGDAGVLPLADALCSNRSLEGLSLRQCGLTHIGAAALGVALPHMRGLQWLGLERNSMGDEGVRALATGLGVNQSLKSLNINRQQEPGQVGEQGGIDLAAGLAANSTLQCLHAGRNRLGNLGASALAEAMMSHPSMQELHIPKIFHKDDVCDEGLVVMKFAEMLSTNKTLKKVYMNGNPMWSWGADTFAETVQSKQTLHTLDIANCYIGYSGVDVLGNMLASHKALCVLFLGRNGLGNTGVQVIAQALLKNQQGNDCGLQELDLSGNEFDDQGAEHLAKVMPSCLNLVMLNLDDNGITNQGAAKLADAVRKMGKGRIGELGLMANPIFHDGFRVLKAAAWSIPTLPKIRLDPPEETMAAASEAKALAAAAAAATAAAAGAAAGAAGSAFGNRRPRG